MSEHMIRVTTRRGECFGLVERDGQVAEGAPLGMAILRRAGITSAREAVKHFRRQGARVEWWPVGDGQADRSTGTPP
jgi:hypothetical protein